MSDRVERKLGQLLESGLWKLEVPDTLPDIVPKDRFSLEGIIFINTEKYKQVNFFLKNEKKVWYVV